MARKLTVKMFLSMVKIFQTMGNSEEKALKMTISALCPNCRDQHESTMAQYTRYRGD